MYSLITNSKKGTLLDELVQSLETCQRFYLNVAFINFTPAEMVIDFAQVLPRTPRGALTARVIMSPIHAKLLHAALGQNLANFERQFGEIRIPHRTNLADDFFRFPGEDEGK